MMIIRCAFKEQLKDVWKTVFNVVLLAIFVLISWFFGFNGVARGMLCGVIVSVVLNWRFTAISSIRVKSSFVPHAKIWLESKGYVMTDKNCEFVPNVSRLLRFDSQAIKFVSKDELTSIIIGPYYMLKKIASVFGVA